jgi:hypothetical protein
MIHCVTFLIITLGLSVSISSSAQDFTTAGSYLTYIAAEYEKIAKEQWDYMKAMGKGKSDKVVDKRRNDLLLAITESRKTISRMPPYNKSTAFRDTIVSFLRVSQIVINQDYEKIIDMEEVAEQSYDLMEAYLLAKEKAQEKLTEASERVSDEQDRFIADNKIAIIENGDESKLSKRMRTAGDVFEYYNNVYLLFFKSYKQEAYLFEALEKGDVNSIEQNRNALLNYSKDNLEAIKPHTSFKQDVTLSTACRETLNFYVFEAEKQVPQLIEFYAVKDKFEKIKKSFDTIKPNDRTKMDIEIYNNAVNEYNAGSKKYNEVSAKTNELRKKAVDNWNRKANAFFQNHMP